MPTDEEPLVVCFDLLPDKEEESAESHSADLHPTFKSPDSRQYGSTRPRTRSQHTSLLRSGLQLVYTQIAPSWRMLLPTVLTALETRVQ